MKMDFQNETVLFESDICKANEDKLQVLVIFI